LNSEKNILVAPLNWGLGHATRCIPIINALLSHGFTPILASDGSALELLRKEFPNLHALELPSYEIQYAQKAENFKWRLLKNSPKTIAAIIEEKRLVKIWVDQLNLIGIISDNRLGVRSKKVSSVFITHQLNVLSGKTTIFSSKLHQLLISKYQECWIPDFESEPNLSGKLGHLKNTKLNLKYIGALSRLKKQEIPVVNDLLILLSGPEPQRTFLEELLLKEVKKSDKKIVFVNGKIEKEQTVIQQNNCTYYNFMQSEQLQKTINESKYVLCRSGYTTVMDLVKLQKKAFFIPTPGQFEQEYLAAKYEKEGLVGSCSQDKFSFSDLEKIEDYMGLPKNEKEIDWLKLFSIFQV
jgi:UDP-N-acetylglucosamine:LPS N-acetylglucosamine transferase